MPLIGRAVLRHRGGDSSARPAATWPRFSTTSRHVVPRALQDPAAGARAPPRTARFTGYVLLGLPAALAVALMFISPDHMRTLFTVKMGQTMVMGAIVMQTIGFIWIRQVIKIEV
jgi:hypothetical protein